MDGPVLKVTQRCIVASLAALACACGGGGSGGGGGSAGGPAPPAPPATPTLPDPAGAPALHATIAARHGVPGLPVGAAIEPASTSGVDATLLRRHFSSITAENAMKPDTIWPNAPGSSGPAPAPNFGPADTLANFASTNGLRLRGHTLLWHQTAPGWFFAGDRSDAVSYRANVRERLREYIHAVVAHFPEVYAWDVVNEVATDAPFAANPYRTDSPWYEAYAVGGADGSEYVRDAFIFAAEARAALPGQGGAGMQLMLNDYNTELPGKRDNVLRIVRELIDAGVPIDGVGHQFHLQLGADVSEVRAALLAVEGMSSTLVNHVTELDVSLYADPGSCYSARTIPPCLADHGASPPQAALSDQARLYRALFEAFNRPSVTSITTWGLADDHTWLNFFPVRRTNRPLLFDAAGLPKWAFWAVVDPAIALP